MSSVFQRRRVRGEPIRVEIDTDGSREYTARGRGGAILKVMPSMSPGKRWYRAEGLMVDFPMRRRGLATKLYEAAANDACAEGRRLVSDVERSAFAESFWRKQKAKGRARCLIPNRRGERANYWAGPELDLEERLAQKYRDRLYGTPNSARASQEMSKVRRGLPKPKGGPEGAYWPCFRWGLRRDLCKKRPFTLDGLPKI